MGKEKRLLLIKEAFQLAQQPHQNQAKLVVAKNLQKKKKNSQGREFLLVFLFVCFCVFLVH